MSLSYIIIDRTFLRSSGEGINMEPVTMIVTALVTGAVAGLKPTAEQAIKDGYEGLKKLIQSKFAKVSIEPLEQKPESKSKQDSVAEDLTDNGADKDEEILRAAQTLIKLIQSQAPEAAEAAGITIAQLQAGSSINIEDVIAEGAITVKGLRAGNIGQVPKKRSSAPND